MHRLALWRGAKPGLRTHLLVFGLAIVVPVLLFAAFALLRYADSERASDQARALEIARTLNAEIEREITAIITTLETLATSDAIALRDFQSFYHQAKEALRSRPWNVLLIDANRRQLMNTRLAWGAPLPVTADPDLDLPRIARETKMPYVSDLLVGTVTKQPVFAVSVPVQIGRNIPYALVMSLEPERLVEILASPALPPGWIAAVADRKNFNMARSRMAREFLGRPVPEESLRQYGGRAEGVITTTDLEGQRALHAFHWSRLTGWRIAAWAPLSVVEGQVRRAWTLFLLSGLALLSMSLLLAFGVGRLMAAPIGALMQAGAALGRGEPVVPVASTLREADELSLVLGKAARELGERMEAQAHLAAIVTSSPSAVISLAPDGTINTWNAAATQVFGYTSEEAIGRPASILCPEGEREAFDQLYARVRSGEVVHADVVRRHKDGRLIDVSANVASMYDAGGRLVGISSINRDIAERKARERHIEFLMHELAHRSKNLLAVVQAIAGQTARYAGGLDDFQARFSQRVGALARTQDILVGRNWQGVGMHELITVQLAPFAEKGTQRIEMQGPDVELKPNVVHNMALALHELATNAAKYGALSVPEGRVAIAWELTGTNGSERRLRLTWREHGGPPVEPPTRSGFGHVVISDMAAGALGGEVQLDFARDGLVWSLDVPSAGALA